MVTFGNFGNLWTRPSRFLCFWGLRCVAPAFATLSRVPFAGAHSHSAAEGYAACSRCSQAPTVRPRLRVPSCVGFRTAEAVLQLTAGTDFAGSRSAECDTATGLLWFGSWGRGRFHGTRGGAKGYGSVHGYRGDVLAGLLVALKAGQCGTATKGHNISIPVSLKGSRSLFLWYSLIAKSVKK